MLFTGYSQRNLLMNKSFFTTVTFEKDVAVWAQQHNEHGQPHGLGVSLKPEHRLHRYTHSDELDDLLYEGQQQILKEIGDIP